VPDDFRSPKRYKYQAKETDIYGIYDCGSNLHLCVTYRDHAVLDLNVNSLLDAHQGLLRIIDDHNQRINQDKSQCDKGDSTCWQMYYERSK